MSQCYVSTAKSVGLEEAEGACPSAGANRFLLVCFQVLNLTCLFSLRTFVSDVSRSSEQTPLGCERCLRFREGGRLEA